MAKRICLTGGEGFIGHHLIEEILKNTDWEIVSIDRLDCSGNPNRLADIDVWEKEKKRVITVWWDLKADLNDVVVKQIGDFDYMVHMAAGSHVDRSIENPMSFVMDNVIGTGNILEFMRRHHKNARMLYFSTDEVYGPMYDHPYKEFERLNPGNPYSATKAGAECLCQSYANTYGMDIIITNTMNIFGERQHPEKFIPLVIKRVLSGEKISIHANPELTKSGTRYYLHARNASKAVIFLLKNGKGLNGKATEGKYNIVGDKEVSNLDMALKIAEIIGKPLNYELVNFHQSRPGHDLQYGLDGSLLKEIGFEYPKSFEETLENTIRWELLHPQWL